MMHERARIGRAWIVALLASGAILAGCAGNEPEASSGEASASVGFVGLEDGAAVSSPLEVCLEVSDLTIEASGEVRAGAGHHHVIVDPSTEEKAGYVAGTITDPLPKDETHLHMGDGSSCIELELAPGEHELLAVVADGLHVPMDPPVVELVSITVEE